MSTQMTYGQDATPDPVSPDASFLYVQSATSGAFTANASAGAPEIEGTPTPGGGATHLLTLTGHTGNTVYFSDRPDRIFGNAPTERFLNGLGFEPGNPPNAALVTTDADGNEDVLVVELIDPSYEAGSESITYGVNVLSNYTGDGLAHVAVRQQDDMLPETFGEVSLFIDDCPDSILCFSGTLPSNPVGPIPGGPFGNCWQWEALSCQPCGGISRTDLIQRCNEEYGLACGITCIVWEPQDAACC